MNITLIEGLPFVSATLQYRNQSLKIDNILLDTGSGGTIFSIDIVSSINILPEHDDEIHRISGVGGIEYVFEKKVDFLKVGDLKIENFVIEIGQVNYGFNIQGILGINFLAKTNAIIDLGEFMLSSKLFTA
jgi:predicted aspartyl protease